MQVEDSLGVDQRAYIYIYLYTVRVTNRSEVLTQTFMFYQSSFSDKTARIMEENPFTDIGAGC